MIDLSPYSRILKILAIIPVLMGVVNLIEQALPLQEYTTVIQDKRTSVSAKFQTKTYNIEFMGLDDQFTEEIYNTANIGDHVTLYITPFDQQVRGIHFIKSGDTYENSTMEIWAILGFTLVFLLAGLSWLKKGWLKKRQALYLAIIIVFACISVFRILRNLI